MVGDFHAYERELALKGLIPLLRKRGFDPTGKSVLDVGCGYGGVLAGLAGAFDLKSALGLDLDAVMVREGSAKCPSGVRLEVRDFFAMDAAEAGSYDLILLRDVLEHIPDAEGALAKAASLLAPRGLIFASFAPFYSPFGGHQHNGSGFFSNVPWLQALPESWFRAALRLDGNSYKSGKSLAEDMETVLRTRLTIGRFRRMIPGAGLRAGYLARYLSRPDYRIKFGLPEIGFPPIPFLDELACTGVEALLEKADAR
ncbi:MAG: 3-demethylubiquinone-9 3-methyltransferase [Fibrobacteres bacterium]|nr:3-demethylubiquinone-9 3-methyltransferase [Fibrobacterota bacterium]